MSIAIENLNESARANLALHFLALPAGDRYLRFGMVATPEIIARYIDGIDFKRDAVFAVRAASVGDLWRGALAGVVHAAFPQDCAELGVSVLPSYRGRGLASTLSEHAIVHARRRGVRRLSMQLLGDNAPMIRVACKLGMTIFGRGTHVFAQLELGRRDHPRGERSMGNGVASALQRLLHSTRHRLTEQP
jgi:GNAT superfamily N-acetyltransferase